LTSFLIVHGWQNRRPADHWQHWLAGRLRTLSHQVSYPQMPDPDNPKPQEWADTLRRQLTLMRHSRHVVICHSLGCMAWLHLAAAHRPAHAVDQLLFVAPPSPDFLAGQDELREFSPSGPVGPLLRASCRTRARLVCSNNDPYCEQGANHVYPGAFDVDFLPAAGHLDVPAGYGAWPSLLAWCANPATRITARPATVAAVSQF
jgi:uncharacterized protein